MKTGGPLAFHILDLPAEGVEVQGDVSYASLDIAPDEVLSFPWPLHFELNLSPVQDGVLVRGRLAGTVRRACDRCLADGTIALAVPDVCHHFENVVGTVLDLTEALREDTLLALPQAWLCRAECRGLCPQCGCDLNRGTCRCRAVEADADGEDPWAVLDGLTERGDG